MYYEDFALGLGKMGYFEKGLVYESSLVRVFLENIVPHYNPSSNRKWGFGLKMILKIENKTDEILDFSVDDDTVKLNNIFYLCKTEGTGVLLSYSFAEFSIIVPYENLITGVDFSEIETDIFSILEPVKISDISFVLNVSNGDVFSEKEECYRITLKDKFGSKSFIDFIYNYEFDILLEDYGITVALIGFFTFDKEYFVLLLKNDNPIPVSAILRVENGVIERFSFPTIEPRGVGLVSIPTNLASDFSCTHLIVSNAEKNMSFIPLFEAKLPLFEDIEGLLK